MKLPESPGSRRVVTVGVGRAGRKAALAASGVKSTRTDCVPADEAKFWYSTTGSWWNTADPDAVGRALAAAAPT
ncbi:MAG: hypothetical protein IPH10_08560 [bacterium]|nr:hypothetical protein [bacterium]